MCPAENGPYVAAGYTSTSLNYDLLMLEIDADGAIVWKKVLGGGGDDYCFKVKKSNDGGYGLVGYNNVPGLSADAYLLRINSIGDTLWTRTYGELMDEQGRDFIFTQDGGYMVFGFTSGDIYNIKTDENGSNGCFESHPSVDVSISDVVASNWTPDLTSGYVEASITPVVFSAGYTLTLCSSVDVQNIAFLQDEWLVYPNPTANVVHLQFTSLKSGVGTLNVLDAMGRLVLRESLFYTVGLNQMTQENSSLSAGIYHVQFELEGKTMSQKLVVQSGK